ncbi:MAG: Lrp/AsnC family transcriptional regulator [Thiolinea sp.]
MDQYDKHILRALTQNSRLSWIELGEQVNLSASAVQRRVQQLQKNGAIKHFSATLDNKKLGFEVRAFVEVKVERHNVKLAQDFRQAMRDNPQVQSCYKLSGTVDFMLDIVATDLESYGRFIEHSILALPGVLDARSSILLEEVKAFTAAVESD